MRGWVVAVLFVAGCAFEVRGVGPGPGSAGGGGMDDNAGGAPVSGEQPTVPTSPMNPPVVGGDDGGAVPLSTEIGDACDKLNSPCSTGQVCETKTAFNTPIPGGYCSMDCNTTPCPTGSQCATGWGSAFRVCIQDCPAAGCRTGYVCCQKGWQAPGACLPPSLCSGG